MQSHNKIFALLSIFFIIPFIFVYPQTQEQSIASFKPVQGLPSKIATSVFKDSRGFMWFGTENGLYRWDGYEFKVFHYDPDDSTSISGNMIWKILFEDNKGNLWIGTASNGLNIYNPNTGEFTHDMGNSCWNSDYDFNFLEYAHQDENGDTWMLGRHNSGIVRLNRLTGVCKVFKPFNDTAQPANFMISAINQGTEGRIWIGSSNGMYVFDKEEEAFIKMDDDKVFPEEIISALITAVFEDKDQIVWVGTRTGLFKYNTILGTVEQFKYNEGDEQSLCSNDIISIYDNPLDKGKSLWIVTPIGINKFYKSNGTVSRFNNDPDDPKSNIWDAVFDMFLDNTGMLWMGTSVAGAVVFNLNPNPFTKIDIGPFENDPYQYEATSFLEDQSGNFWVGTGYGGLFKYNDHMELLARYKYDPGNPNRISYNYIFSLYEDFDGVLWVGTVENLDVFDRKTNLFISCFHTIDDKIDYYRINDIIQDDSGYLWLGSNRGLYYKKKRKILNTSFQGVAEFCSDNIEIRKIAKDPTGALWFGSTGEGLFQLTPENRKTLKFNNYRHDPDDLSSLSDDIVQSVYVDYKGVLWLGTSTGLNRFDKNSEQFYCFNKENGLDANFIYFIEGDNNGNLWLSTEKGIIRFTQLSDSTAHTKLLEHADGIPFDDNYQFKFYRSKDGKIYIGGRRVSGDGYYYFHPDSLKDNEHIPPVVLTEFLVKNKPIKTDSSITVKKYLELRHNQNFFSMKFAALDFVNPSKNEYAYMLEGFDEDWIYCNTRRLANYTNVPPGDYVFRAKGSNNDGVWNEAGVSLNITVFPPPWKTWWAYSFYILFLIGVFYAWRRYDLKRQKLKQQLELEHVQTEKLEELDRMKSQFFANISHEFRTPLTLILGPLEKLRTQISVGAKKDLDMMQRNARRLQNLINQLLSLSKLESGKMKLQAQEVNIVSLVNRYVQSFESLAKQKNIKFKFSSSEENIQLFVDKDKIEKILYNLLSNAFKFTGEGGRIEVNITPPGPPCFAPLKLRESEEGGMKGGVNISISDTGHGIPQEKLEHIFDRFYQVDDNYTKDQEGTGIGLALTKELVELHHGTITVDSTLGRGTTFTVFLPLGKEHLKPEEVIEPAVRRDSYGESVKPDDWDDPPDQITEIYDQVATKDDDIEKDETKPLLLMVEDNDDLRSYIRSYLAQDYRIIEAIDGEMGLDKAIEKIPDLIISDVMMPKMDGMQLCRKLKTDERTSHIPIILLTAKAGMEDKLEGLETGADDFLTKPFDPDELLVRIRNLIQQRRKLKEIILKNIGSVNQLSNSGITSMDQTFLKKAVEVVEKYISDAEFTVELFGKEMAMSRVQLHRKLTALVEQPAGDFIRTIRLNKAATLLKEKSGNIAEIAYGVGFSNPSYFSECFRKQFGKLPSEYIR